MRPTRIAQPDCSSEIASRLTLSGSTLSSRSLIYFCPFVAQRPLRLLSLSRLREEEREMEKETEARDAKAAERSSCGRVARHFSPLVLVI